ncbi:YjbF family lipoprotein [Pseudophaeobacter sp.]|uniref:YjbF family lipoprotein n=1 Tax=Pseudophaeobacter sp. TaxID=1971739 RepID=UPI00329685A0
MIHPLRLRFGAALLVALTGLLSACSKGPDGPTTQVQLSQAIREAIQERRAPKTDPVRATRAMLLELGNPHIEIVVENLDFLGYLALVLTRSDDQPGTITQWNGGDGTALILRNGMLIASRGLGGNLLSADVPARGQQPGPGRGGQRSYQIRSGDNIAQRLTFACSLQDLGPARLEIVERSYNTRHLQEYCETGSLQNDPQGRIQGETHVIINDYWVDSRGGEVWQSRQWAGPEIGYLRIRNLTN